MTVSQVVPLVVLAALLTAIVVSLNAARAVNAYARKHARASKAADRKHAKALQEHEQHLAHHRKLLTAHQRDLSQWAGRLSDLQALLEEAKSAPKALETRAADLIRSRFGSKLKREEQVFYVGSGEIVEVRTRQHVPTTVVVESGKIAITSQRVLFQGTKRREWAFEKTVSIQHVASRSDMSLIQVTNRKTLSGIRYDDAERARMHLEFAAADDDASRRRVVADIQARVDEHARRRPIEPQGPPPEPERVGALAPAPVTGQRPGSRGRAARSIALALMCAAIIFWPLAPALRLGFDPAAQPGRSWPVAGIVFGLLSISSLFASVRAEAVDDGARGRRRSAILAVGALVLATLVAGVGFASPASALEGEIERVVDGDTVVVRVQGREINVRILNIDTPETVHPSVEDECLGHEATRFTKQLLLPGTRVDLSFDSERRDRYGRTLAAVSLPDGRSVATEIASAGLGIPMVVGGNDAFFDPVLDAFRFARAEGRGYFDPTIECTIPAHQAQLRQDVAAAKTAEAGVSAAEAAVAAGTVLALSNAHSKTVGLIRAGRRFAVRAMIVVGATTALAAYEVGVASLGAKQRELAALKRKRKRAEAKAEAARQAALAAERRARREAAREARRAAQEAAREAREAQAQEEAERQDYLNSLDNDDDDGDDGGGWWPPGVPLDYTGPRCYQPGGVTWYPC